MNPTELGLVLTVAGIVVSVILKISEYRAAVAKEKFIRRLDACERLIKAAMLMATASPFKSWNEKARGQYNTGLRAIQDSLLQSLPLLPAQITREDGECLSQAARSPAAGFAFEDMMDKAFDLSRIIRGELGTKGDLSVDDRILLGLNETTV